jgi:ABC-2 type transport system permease protein
MRRGSWFRPLCYLVQKEFRQVFRDLGMLRIIFILPIIQLFLFGYAATTDIKHVRLAVLDEDRSVESRNLTSAFFASDLFEHMADATSPKELQDRLVVGDADMTLWIRRGFREQVANIDNATVSIAVDGQNSSTAGRAMGYAESILRLEAQRVLAEWRLAHPTAPRVGRIEAVTRFYFNPELESRYYMIPGIVVLILTIVSTLLTGMAVVKEKEIGTLEQLMVTPITPVQLIVGKTVPFVVLAFFELTFATTIAVLWFKLPLVGSITLLAVSAMIYLLATLGVGLLVSTVSHTQQQAMFTVWFFLVFGILTSGFFYPIENMPGWIQTLTYVNPLRYFVAVIRGIFLKGSGLTDLLPQLAPLALLGALTFSVAVLRFHKTVR